ncbi:MAG: NAD(P)/FAD-dependent oxidoreductase, partial [Erysipelotrichaceae bacterium]|nr:NAD(P)/FAD-dependent oxidoreductase [Erysipelotrichaceae bacterium]
AFKAADNGLSVIIFEKDKVGGTCLNRGCIPTKSLLHSSEKYAIQKEALPQLAYDWQKAVETKNQTVESLRSGIEKQLKAKKIALVNSSAFIRSEHIIEAADQQYEVDNILIAAGSQVSFPPIPGIDSEFVITSDDLLQDVDLRFESLTIIGGGVIGVECASVYLKAGKKVTILEIADHILPTMDPEIAQRLNMFLKKQGAEILTKVRIDKIEENIVYCHDSKDNELAFQSDRILVAAGRKPSIEKLVSDEVNIELSRGIIGDQYGKTSVKNIFVAGDVKDRNIQLAHVAAAQGRNIVDLIVGKQPHIDMSVVPSCIYTDPEIASVGLYEKQAKEMGLNVTSRKVLTGANGRSLIEEAASGYAKIVLDENKVIIGAQLVCPHATELISELAVALQKKMTVSQLGQVIHPHPTVAEMITELCE